jgi:hypothetical protein
MKDPASYLSGTELRVCQLIAERQMRGIEKYGTTVSDNPLPLHAWLRHALEECLDQAIYLQRAIEELDAQPKPFRDVNGLMEAFKKEIKK